MLDKLSDCLESIEVDAREGHMLLKGFTERLDELEKDRATNNSKLRDAVTVVLGMRPLLLRCVKNSEIDADFHYRVENSLSETRKAVRVVERRLEQTVEMLRNVSNAIDELRPRTPWYRKVWWLVKGYFTGE